MYSSEVMRFESNATRVWRRGAYNDYVFVRCNVWIEPDVVVVVFLVPDLHFHSIRIHSVYF